MAKLAAGATIALTLPAGSFLSMFGQGTVQVSPPGSNGQVNKETQDIRVVTKTIGGLGVAVTVNLMATLGGPGLTYSFASSAPALDTVTAETVTSSRNLTQADNGLVIPVANGVTLTAVAGTLAAFSAVLLPVNGATASLAFSGGATGNGATTTITRARTANAAGFAVIQDYATGQDAFAVGGV